MYFSWSGFARCKQSPLSISVWFYTSQNNSSSLTRCLKTNFVYQPAIMHVFMLLVTLCVKRWQLDLFYLPFLPLIVSYCNTKGIETPQDCLLLCLTPPPSPMNHQRNGHIETSTQFWHCPPTPRPSNYSS